VYVYIGTYFLLWFRMLTYSYEINENNKKYCTRPGTTVAREYIIINASAHAEIETPLHRHKLLSEVY
jgi:hypothetical protein